MIIVDDLDRCLPEKAVQVLEAIKLFLDVKGCVFLMAVDRRVVERAISVKYRDVLAMARETGDDIGHLATFLGANYFEKIIQLPLSLPPLYGDDIERLISSLCTDKDVKLCCPVFVVGLPHNPRKVKRALQLFLFLRDLVNARIQGGTIKVSLLAKLVVIQDQFPILYRDKIVDSPWLLPTLEMYYDHPSEFNEGVIDENLHPELRSAITFAAMVEETKATASKHPLLGRIFLKNVEKDAAFVDAPINDYIFFMKAITEVALSPEVRPEPVIDPTGDVDPSADTTSFTEALPVLARRLDSARSKLARLEKETADCITQGMPTSPNLEFRISQTRAFVDELQQQIAVIEWFLKVTKSTS